MTLDAGFNTCYNKPVFCEKNVLFIIRFVLNGDNMFVCRCIKNTFWLSVGIMFILFIGFVSTVVVKTVRKGYVCDTLYNATKAEILKCKAEVAMKTGYDTLSDLFDYYDKNVNITGTQKTPVVPKPPSVPDDDNDKEDNQTTKRHAFEISADAPVKLRSYKNFIDCMSDSNCGIISKCYYDLNINEKYNSNVEHINGSVFVIKNYVPYHVDYFWDVYGCGEGGEETASKVFHARLSPNSAVHVDSLCYGVHTMRLYVDPNQYVYGEGVKLYTNASTLSDNPTIDELEPILTVLSSNLECSRAQSCRYLSDVCFAKSDTSDRCETYRMACNYFSDVDESAKDYCLQDCFYMHHPTCIPPNATLKTESLVQWVCRGGGIEGSPVDGNINSGPIIALSVLFSTACVMLVGTCVSLHTYKRKLMAAEKATISNYF